MDHSGLVSHSESALYSPSESMPSVRRVTDEPTFTFIDHDDDLSSKRIKDANARRAIRSHVMRDVRRRERLAGFKRVSKRESRTGKSVESPFVQSNGLELQIYSPNDAFSSRESPPSLMEPKLILDDIEPKQQALRQMVRNTKSSSPSSPELVLSPCLAPSLLDPFTTLPGAKDSTGLVNQLVFYWKSVFFPMTFPKEHKFTEQAKTDLMLRTSFTDAGSFFGLMSMCAAHRAIMAGRHSDLQNASASPKHPLHDENYYILKGKCIGEMSAKAHNSTQLLSIEALGTIINLISGALMVGLFDEARIHLRCLKHVVELRGGLTDSSFHQSSTLAAIAATDVKAASGLMAKPVFPLAWDSQSIPAEIQLRIVPLDTSPLGKLGTGFSKNTALSIPLLRIFNVIRSIILYSHTCKETPSVLWDSDHDFFRVLNCEVEHRLLSYEYPTKDTQNSICMGLHQDSHHLEYIARVAAICYLNYFLIISPPSTGLGRALTKHLKQAVSNCILTSVPREKYGMLAWALFVGAQGSMGQVEYPWFLEKLSHIVRGGGWRDWDHMSDALGDYFYLPAANRPLWEAIWNEAMPILEVWPT